MLGRAGEGATLERLVLALTTYFLATKDSKIFLIVHIILIHHCLQWLHFVLSGKDYREFFYSGSLK